VISSQFLVLFLLSRGGENERREIARAHLFFVMGRAFLVPPTSESSRRYPKEEEEEEEEDPKLVLRFKNTKREEKRENKKAINTRT
jgi:hypothetical protein